MKDIHAIHHDLKRDIHNILSLLKFIESDVEIKDPEIKLLLDMALKRESNISESLDVLIFAGKDQK